MKAPWHAASRPISHRLRTACLAAALLCLVGQTPRGTAPSPLHDDTRAGATTGNDAYPIVSDTGSHATRAPEPPPSPATLAQVWDDLDSPLHHGDRRVPLQIEVAPGKIARVFVERCVEKESGLWVMRGHTGAPLSSVAGARIGSALALTVMDPVTGENYSVLPTATGTRLVDLRHRRRCPATAPTPPHLQAAGANFERPRAPYDELTEPVGTRRITLAAYYAPGVGARLDHYGGLNGLRVMTETAIELTNVALSRAGADARIDVVGLSPLDFADDDTEALTVLTRFSTALAAVRERRQLRTPSDLSLGIIAHAITPVGFAWSPGEDSIIVDDFLASSVVAHEIGHSFGMNHERAIVPASAQNHPFAYGYRVDTTNPRVMDVMSYGEGHSELLLYSGPENTFLGVPVGDERNHNARLAREQCDAVAGRSSADYDFTGDNWLINESARGEVGNGEAVMIAGLVIQGTAERQIVLRGLGPSLSLYGIERPLPDPTLRLMDARGREIEFNDDWADGPRVAELRETNLVPLAPNESVIVRTLPPGLYTVILANAQAGGGVGLVEVYGLDPVPRLGFAQAGAQQRLWSEVTTDFNTYHAYRYEPGEFVTWTRYLVPHFHAANRTVQRMLVLWSEPTLGFELKNLAPPEAMLLAAHPWREQIRALAPFATDTMHAALIDFDATAASQSLIIHPFLHEPALPRRDSASVVPRATTVHVYSLRREMRPLPPAANLINLSARAVIGVGERCLIGGLVVHGNTAKTYVFRALGEGLRQSGIARPAHRIGVTIHDGIGVVRSYTATPPEERDLLAAWNLLPPSPDDIAGCVTLAPGAYTFVVTASTESDVGIGLFEIYAISRLGEAR